ncbi:MAG TPA: protein kinase [Thermoanaerobaculia bacterium]|nr:protein kinase [Thermoanaerobaculia bacterium]
MLSPGVKLGPYEILAPLGAGGMGEVYRARDTKLHRDVAIKVLPESLSKETDALGRFEREAHAVAALNHPNILSIHDFGESNGVVYAVTELLEGESLRERLDAGPIPTRKAVDYAVQILRGLAAAHEKGVVHRDLKPENLFVTADGRVKILDFGLAKVVSAESVATSAPTTPAGTEPGTVMGTVGYMSPEQVRGRPADHRSDIFSFGVVLYEMLSGKRAFQRESAAETMAAIAREEPPELAESGRKISPALDRIVRHCLEKSPAERAQSAHDLAFELESMSALSESGAAAVAFAPRRRRRLAIGVAAAVAAVLAVAALASYRAGRKAERRSVEAIAFRQMSFHPQAIFQAAFMPDGETIVYSAAPEGNVPELFTIRPEFPEPRALGLPRTHLLSISSKGELAVLTHVRYLAHRLFTGTLARVSLGGTAPREILENVRQADWSPDGANLAVLRVSQGKDRLEFPIGKVLYESAGYLSDLRLSPRGDRIALFEHPKQWDDRGSVICVDMAGKRTVLSGEYWGEEGLAWSRTGDEIFFTASTEGFSQVLYGVDLSGRRRVVLTSAGGLTMHDVSRTGRWLVTRDDQTNAISVLVPGAGAERDLSWLDFSEAPFLSRDGSLLLFNDESSAAGPNYAVCLRKTDGGAVVRLGEGFPCGLSPDEKWALAIVYSPPQLVMYPTGPGETRRLPRGRLETYQSASWFADGKKILACGNEPGRGSRCYSQDVSDGSLRPVTPEGASNGSVSPDGTQVLYSNQDGAWLVQPMEGGTGKPLPEIAPDESVIRWSPDSRSLYVFHPATLPFRFERLDLASGRRELIREVAPADRTGLLEGGVASITEDTRSYAYDYSRMTSQLFVVSGAR